MTVAQEELDPAFDVPESITNGMSAYRKFLGPIGYQRFEEWMRSEYRRGVAAERDRLRPALARHQHKLRDSRGAVCAGCLSDWPCPDLIGDDT